MPHNETKHTLTPWKIEIWSYDNLTKDKKAVLTNGTNAICELYNIPEESGETYKANAAFIVTACNAHEDLIGALIESQAALGDLVREGQANDQQEEAYQMVKNALSRAGVKP